MDSLVAAAHVKAEGVQLISLAVDYGQRTRVELDAARSLASWLESLEHVELAVDLRAVGGSALTAEIAVPKGKSASEGIPVTYVPARNTLLLALALGLAEARGADAMVIGANQIDYSGYPDCRPEFLDAFDELARVGTKAGVEGRPPKILAPLLHLSKAEIVARGLALDVPFRETVSCYDPDGSGAACGACDSCALRRAGFDAAGVKDPTRYTNR